LPRSGTVARKRLCKVNPRAEDTAQRVLSPAKEGKKRRKRKEYQEMAREPRPWYALLAT
jgi:hypothetical protein